MKGWIKLDRKIEKWRYAHDLKYCKVWLTMLIEANWQEKEFEGETIKAGELVFTYRTWADKFKDCKPIITKQNLETIIKNLRVGGEITVRQSNRKRGMTIIRIKNYAEYQNIVNEDVKNKTGGNESSRQKDVKNKTEAAMSHQTPLGQHKPFTYQGVADLVSKDLRHQSCLEQDSNFKNQDTKKLKTRLPKECSKENLKNIFLTKNNIKELTNDAVVKFYYDKKGIEFLELTDSVVEYMNRIRMIEGLELISPADPETLKSVCDSYEKGHTELAGYKSIMDLVYSQFKYRGGQALKYFRPQTLFFKKFDKYIAQVKKMAKFEQLEANKEVLRDKLREDMLKDKEEPPKEPPREAESHDDNDTKRREMTQDELIESMENENDLFDKFGDNVLSLL